MAHGRVASRRFLRYGTLRWLLFVCTVLQAAGGRAESWDGSYAPKQQSEADGTSISYDFTGCDSGTCTFSYEMASHHACSYEGSFALQGNEGRHHAAEDESEDDAEERLECELTFRFERRGREQWVDVEEPEGSNCRQVAACGAMASVVTGKFLKSRPRPSFDCQRAANVLERTICADSALAADDAELARRFAPLRKRVELLPNMVAQQRVWLEQRRTCMEPSPNAACLRDLYRERIETLAAVGYYLRLFDTVPAGKLPTPWQASGFAELFAADSAFGDFIYRRWLDRAVHDGYLSDEVRRGDVYCDELEALKTPDGVIVRRNTCPPGHFSLEMTRTGEFWLAYDENDEALIANYRSAGLEAAPDSIKEWLEAKAESKRQKLDTRPTTMTWPTNAVFTAGCFWADKSFAEWAPFFRDNGYGALAEDAQARLRACKVVE